MTADKNCRYRNRNRKEACFEHCHNWVTDNYSSLNKQIVDDRNHPQKYTNYFDVNIEIVILITVFLVLAFIVHLIFNLRR